MRRKVTKRRAGWGSDVAAASAFFLVKESLAKKKSSGKDGFFVFTEERDGAATLLLPPFSFGERKLGKKKSAVNNQRSFFSVTDSIFPEIIYILPYITVSQTKSAIPKMPSYSRMPKNFAAVTSPIIS